MYPMEASKSIFPPPQLSMQTAIHLIGSHESHRSHQRGGVRCSQSKRMSPSFVGQALGGLAQTTMLLQRSKPGDVIPQQTFLLILGIPTMAYYNSRNDL